MLGLLFIFLVMRRFVAIFFILFFIFLSLFVFKGDIANFLDKFYFKLTQTAMPSIGSGSIYTLVENCSQEIWLGLALGIPSIFSRSVITSRSVFNSFFPQLSNHCQFFPTETFVTPFFLAHHFLNLHSSTLKMMFS